MRVFWIIFAQILLSLAGALAYCCWPRQMFIAKPQSLAAMDYVGGRPVIFWRDRYLVGKLAELNDAFSAYLMFDYLRAREPLKGMQVMLTIDRASPEAPYRILVRLPDDLIAGITHLAQLEAKHLTSHVDFAWITRSQLSQDLQETTLFSVAYNDPNVRGMEQISPDELRSYLRRFIRFKSATDPRTWEKTQWPVSPVSMAEADLLAGDIATVADFYGLPVDLLLGIGAMENNFLNAPGDLNNAIWKRRVERDDIVLQHKGHTVRILNSAIGIWQITRQSLRHAHRLFLADKRDYSILPQRLRPAKQLDMENLDSDVLTTYAGLLLRDLLDHFEGDTMLAAGAYNGTVRHPNFQYAEGVEMVASYARRVIGNAAELNRMAIALPTSVRERDPEEHPVKLPSESSINFLQ